MDIDNKYIPKKGDWIMWVSGGKPLIAEVLMSRKQDYYPWKIEWVTTEGITSTFVEVRSPKVDPNILDKLEDRNHRDAMEAAFGWHGQG